MLIVQIKLHANGSFQFSRSGLYKQRTCVVSEFRKMIFGWKSSPSAKHTLSLYKVSNRNFMYNVFVITGPWSAVMKKTDNVPGSLISKRHSKCTGDELTDI